MASARLTWNAARSVSVLDGSYARFGAGWWASQVAGSFYALPLLGSRTGLAVHADGSIGRVSDGAWSGSFTAGPIGSVLLGQAVLLSAGVEGGLMRRVDSMSSGTVGATLRARSDFGSWTIQSGLETTHARGIDITDATADVGLRLGPVNLGTRAGARTGDVGGKPWLQGRAEYRAAPWATLELQGGTYPRDITGFTGGRFVSFGVWLRPFARSSRPGVPGFRRGSPSEGVTIEAVSPGRERVTFVVPGAQTVAIAGEWNDWTPVALQRLDARRWRTEVALGKGAHRFSLLVDGGRWVVPSGVPSMPDSFGGTVGLLVVDQ